MRKIENIVNFVRRNALPGGALRGGDVFKYALIFSIFHFPFSIMLSGCANQMAPQGGPKDSLPPVVRSMTPGGGARNLKPRRIFIETDEFIQLRDLSKEMYTSPLMKTKPTVTVKGRGLRIDIKDTLEENRTYSINFGSAIRDNNESNPLTGFRYVFSTGAALDSLLATGYMADAARGDSVGKAFLFFYEKSLVDSVGLPDSTLYKVKPSAVGRSENNGIFIAQNLRDTRYWVYALMDANNNQRYDAGTDLVGFLDTMINPAQMEPTAVWLDEERKYPTADPQLYVRMFSEPAVKRQNMTASERPMRHQVVLRFAAPNPQIDTLAFEGIDSAMIVREYISAGRDTMALWFNKLPMPDTLRGRISYRRPDSLGNMMSTGKDLRLVWRKVENRDEQRAREELERERERARRRGEPFEEPKPKNPFGFKVDAGVQVNPYKGIPIEFEMPLARLDSAAVVLEEVPSLGDPAPKKFRFERDSVNIRRWVLRAEWREGENYRLMIPEGALVNVADERNDSLEAKFAIDRRSDFATVRFDVRGKSDSARYIIQIMGTDGKRVIREARVGSGPCEMEYLAEGDVKIRVVEDLNANGVWDSGVLLERRQPERTEFYSNAGEPIVTLAKGGEMNLVLEMSEIFGPVTIERIRGELQRAEDARVGKAREERAKREAEQRDKPENSGGGLGIGNALGSAKSQIESTVR